MLYQFVTLDGRILYSRRSRRWAGALDEFKEFARENVERFASRISTAGNGSADAVPEAVRLLDAEGNEVYRLELGDLTLPVA
jgi:hypothetical protein